MKGVPHFLKNGTPHGKGGKGSTHKMKDGTLHSNKTHTKTNKPLFHMKELSPTAQKKAKAMMS